MQIKKQQLQPYMEQRTGAKLGKEYSKAVYYHPYNLNADYNLYVCNLHADYIMQKAAG